MRTPHAHVIKMQLRVAIFTRHQLVKHVKPKDVLSVYKAEAAPGRYNCSLILWCSLSRYVSWMVDLGMNLWSNPFNIPIWHCFNKAFMKSLSFMVALLAFKPDWFSYQGIRTLPIGSKLEKVVKCSATKLWIVYNIPAAAPTACRLARFEWINVLQVCVVLYYCMPCDAIVHCVVQYVVYMHSIRRLLLTTPYQLSTYCLDHAHQLRQPVLIIIM